MSDSRENKDREPALDPRRDADGAETRVPAPGEAGAQPVGRWSRRRFGKTALGVTPVIATLYGRPLWAAANCTPSGWISGNTSLHHEPVPCAGAGRTPGFWQGPGSESIWGSHREELLNSAFGFQGRLPQLLVDDGDMPEATMQDAVSRPVVFVGVPQSSLERKLLFFGTAALLNAKFTSGYLHETQVRDMVVAAVAGVNYVAGSGDELTPAQVKAFLQNTMEEPTFFDPSLLD